MNALFKISILLTLAFILAGCSDMRLNFEDRGEETNEIEPTNPYFEVVVGDGRTVRYAKVCIDDLKYIVISAVGFATTLTYTGQECEKETKHEDSI